MNKKQRKVISILLVIAMLMTLVPVSAFAATAETVQKTAASGNTDEFGIEQRPMTDEERDKSIKNSPTGTDFNRWVTLSEINELFIANNNRTSANFKTYDYSTDIKKETPFDPKKGFLLNKNTSGSGSQTNDKDNQWTCFDATAFDTGSGQKDMVATIGVQRINKNGSNLIIKTINPKTGSEVANRVVNGSDNDKDCLEAFDNCEPYEQSGFASIAAGDFNGDGKDTLICYAPWTNNWGPGIFEVNTTDLQGNDAAGDVEFAKVKDIMGVGGIPNTGKDDKRLRNTPKVQMAVADLDKDSIDELVITASLNEVVDAPSDVKLHSQMFIYDKVKTGDKWSWHQTFHKEFKGDTFGLHDAKRLRWATSSIGDLNLSESGVDYPEIFSAGWIDTTDGTGTSLDNEYTIGTYTTSCNATVPEGDSYVGEYITQASNNFLKASEFSHKGRWSDTNIKPLLRTAVFAADNVKNKCSVMVDDTVYHWTSGGPGEIRKQGGYFTTDHQHHFEDIKNAFVLDAEVGNFTGSKDGKQQVMLATLEREKQSSNDYYIKLFCYGTNEKGEMEFYEGGRYEADNEDVATYAIAAPDIDSDSVIARLKEVSRSYTEPKVLGILEATPYFSEVEGGDIKNSATAYGTTKGTGTAHAKSDGLSANVVAGFEWNMDDIVAGFVCGAGAETSVETSWTWETVEENSIEYSLEFSNDTGENQVLIYRRPVTNYKYELKGEGSDTFMNISKMGDLATSMMPLDEYNDIAKTNKQVPMIDENIVAEAGNPFSYRSTIGETGSEKYRTSGQSNIYSKDGTITQSITESTTQEDTFSYEQSSSFTAYGLVFGVKAGGGPGKNMGHSETTINTSAITKSGTVSGMSTEGYDFNWEFANWAVKIGKDEIPVLGYLLTNVVAPPTPPTGLSVKDIESTEATLFWEPSTRVADEYRIYHYHPESGKYFPIDSVPGTQTECRLKDLTPGTTSYYVIKSFANKKANSTNSIVGTSVYSNQVAVTTPPKGVEKMTINGPDNQEVAVGQNATFEISFNRPAGYGTMAYEWESSENGKTWKSLGSGDGNSLTVLNVTKAMDGTKYRCKVSVEYQGKVLEFWSDVATLKVGKAQLDVDLKVQNTAETTSLPGEGTLEVPYKGNATGEVKDGQKDVPVKNPVVLEYKVETDPEVKEVTVYKINNDYYGIDNKDQYYQVTKMTEGDKTTYQVGNPITIETKPVYYDKDNLTTNEALKKIPTGFNATTPFKQTINEKNYILKADLGGVKAFTTEENGTDTRISSAKTVTYYWQEEVTGTEASGKYYEYKVNPETSESALGNEKVFTAEEAEKLYTVYAKDDTNIALGRTETIGKTTDNYWYTLLTKAEADYQATPFVVDNELVYKVSGTELTKFEPMKLELEMVETVQKENIYKNQDGTKLKLSATVKNQDVVQKNIPVKFVIVNTVDGSKTELAGKIESNGIVTAEWIAPKEGLYRIEAVTTASSKYSASSSIGKYYDANKPDGLEYRIVLKADGKSVIERMDYKEGLMVKPVLQQRTIKYTKPETDQKNVRKTEVGSWENVSETVYYTAERIGNKDTLKELEADAQYAIPVVGSYKFTASLDKKDPQPINAILAIEPVPIKIIPSFKDGNVGSDNVLLTVKALSGQKLQLPEELLNSVIQINYPQNPNAAGRHTVTLSYKADPEGSSIVSNFRKNYPASFEKCSFNGKENSAPVYFEAGNNGSIRGSFTNSMIKMDSGEVRTEGDMLIFEATANKGYAIDKWYINDVPYSADQMTEFKLSNEGRTLTLKKFDGKELHIRVEFKQENNEITYAVGDESGSTITAKVSKDGSEERDLASGSNVSLGSTVKFTVQHTDKFVVGEWKVNGKTYCLKDGKTPFRGDVLTLEDISENTNVVVYMQDATEKVKVIPQVYNDKNEEESGSATITVTEAYSDKPIKDLNQIPKGTSLKFHAKVAVPTNNMVKEWQTSTDGITFKPLKDTGSKATITIPGVNQTTYVRAIVTTKQQYDLHWNVVGLDEEDQASLVATCNGKELKEGMQSAFIPVQFKLTIPDTYYVTGWEKATEDETNPCQASITSLKANTTVTVNVAKKPVITWTSPIGADITVKGTVNGKADQNVTSGTHVDYNTNIEITVTPKNGYVVEKILGKEVNKDKKNNAVTVAPEQAVTSDFTVSASAIAKPIVTVKDTSKNQGSVLLTAVKDGEKQTVMTGSYVDFGTNLEVLLKPATHFEVGEMKENPIFVKEEDSDQKTYSVKVDGNTTVKPVWKEIPYHTVSLSVVDTNGVADGGMDGTVKASSIRKALEGYTITEEDFNQAHAVYEGSTVTIIAVPEDGYRVKEWCINGEPVKGNTSEKLVINKENLTEDKTVSVQFTELGGNTTVSAKANGTIESATVEGSSLTEKNMTDGFALAENAKLVITAKPDAGYEVDHWTVNGKEQTATTDPLTFEYTGNNTRADIQVSFRQVEYKVTFGAENGTVTADPYESGAMIRGGKTVTFKAEATPGYCLTGWTVNGKPVPGEKAETFKWTVPNGMKEDPAVTEYDVKAVFGNDKYQVTINQTEHGTVEADSKTDNVVGGTEMTFTAKPAEGYVVSGWTVNDDTVKTTDVTRKVTINADTTISATFVPAEYKVTFSANGKGTLSADGAKEGFVMVPYGKDITFTAKPSPYNHVDHWMVDGERAAGNQTEFTLTNVTKEQDVKVFFKGAVGFAVSYQVENGDQSTLEVLADDEKLVLTPDQSKDFVGGTKLVFTANPPSGQMVKEWKVNNVTVTRNNMKDLGVTMKENHHLSKVLTINSLTENVNVTVIYEPKELFTIPQSEKDQYRITDVTRAPSEPGEKTQIRKGGDVTFTVIPENGHYFTSLEVNKVNILTGNGSENLKVKNNHDGSFTVTVENVTENIKVKADSRRFQTFQEPLVVPEILKDKYESVEALEKDLRLEINKADQDISKENTKLFDIVLKYTTDNGKTWKVATDKDFPKGGIQVYIPYKDLGEKAGQDCKFSVVHMFTTGMNDHHPGDMEIIEPVNGAEGITFNVDSLSPFAIGWTVPGEEPAPSPGGGGGGGFIPVGNDITIHASENGKVTSDVETAYDGQTVTLTVTPNAGKALNSLKVFTDKKVPVVVTEQNGKYIFTMPNCAVDVYADFRCNGGAHCPSAHLIDVDKTAWYHGAVDYVVANKIMGGVSANKFAPDVTTSRGMIVTMLYRLEGEPEVTKEVSFKDVSKDAWYAKAVAWAAANDVVSGYSAELFGPEDDITREQMASILYRYADFKGLDVTAKADLGKYEDADKISPWALNVLKWANAEGYITGVSDTMIEPGGNATRAQVAAILMRFCEDLEESNK